jgi:hypothetical protein
VFHLNEIGRTWFTVTILQRKINAVGAEVIYVTKYSSRHGKSLRRIL